jgi:hypothetical protein
VFTIRILKISKTLSNVESMSRSISNCKISHCNSGRKLRSQLCLLSHSASVLVPSIPAKDLVHQDNVQLAAIMETFIAMALNASNITPLRCSPRKRIDSSTSLFSLAVGVHVAQELLQLLLRQSFFTQRLEPRLP